MYLNFFHPFNVVNVVIELFLEAMEPNSRNLASFQSYVVIFSLLFCLKTLYFCLHHIVVNAYVLA